jgi:hypothetical protein
MGHTELIILRLGRDWRRGREVILRSPIAAVVAFIIISVVKTLGLRGKRQRRDVGRAGHDFLGRESARIADCI